MIYNYIHKKLNYRYSLKYLYKTTSLSTHTQFTPIIPNEISMLQQLESIYFENNKFTAEADLRY